MAKMAFDESVQDVAQRLRQAEEHQSPCPPVRDLLGADDIDRAYQVQACNHELALASGRRVVGWKVGLTSPAVQRQLGVNQPDSGALYEDFEVGDGLRVPFDRLLQPKVEAEVAFVLDRDLDEPVTTAAVLRATAFVLPAIEIVDSRIANWDIGIVDTVADNASSAMYVLGPSPRRLTDVDLREITMTMTADGQVVSKGSGAACLGHPVNAVMWLANTRAALGTPLREGDVVLSGALGPMATVKTGSNYEAVIDGLGSVRANFSEEA